MTDSDLWHYASRNRQQLSAKCEAFLMQQCNTVSAIQQKVMH